MNRVATSEKSMAAYIRLESMMLIIALVIAPTRHGLRREDRGCDAAVERKIQQTEDQYPRCTVDGDDWRSGRCEVNSNGTAKTSSKPTRDVDLPSAVVTTISMGVELQRQSRGGRLISSATGASAMATGALAMEINPSQTRPMVCEQRPIVPAVYCIGNGTLLSCVEMRNG